MHSSTETPDSPSADAPDEVPILVGPEWLEHRIGQDDVRVVDLREEESYAEAHVPGAVHLALDSLGANRDGCDNVLLPDDGFSELMERLGVSSTDTVVAYDDQWGLAAARLLWALHRYGHRKVSVLDGGWDRWHDEKRPEESGRSHGRMGRFQAEADSGVFADAEWIGRRAAEAVLLDTRSRAEFDRGHLPDALCWDWFNAVPPGSWGAARSVDELLDEWRALGLTPSDEAVVYCRSGMRAAHTYMVLRHAGFERVRLYDGSWQDWSRLHPKNDDD